MLPSRNVGVTVSGTGFKRRMSWAAGVLKVWIDASQSFDESATQVVGRVTGLPFVAEDESHLVHLGLGVGYTDAEEGLRYFTEPEFNNASVFVSTGDEPFLADRSVTYDLELAWRRGPIWVSGEPSGTRWPLRAWAIRSSAAIT